MIPFVSDPDFTLYVGDALETLRGLPDESVHCCVTSPPYWGLRDYGTDGQIGLEATPELFVESMVAVFREVRRVLRSDGTLWLNLGDSYTSIGRSGRKESPGVGATQQMTRVERDVVWAQRDEGDPDAHFRWSLPGGQKPKDLVGIPWRVAFALQQPYYTGTIKDERDRAWLAAMIDAEGCVFIHKRKVGQSNGQGYDRKSDTYGSGLEVSNTNRAIVERVLAIVGKGSISTSTRGRNQPLYRWNLRSNECRDVLREVYPHLVSKQHQARLAIGCPSSGMDAERAHASLIALHNGDVPTIDFAAPDSMFEPGWYLRSDIVWSKSNPMPESVTDRPTKAHEYVFLLTKSPRYFYDAEAIREEYAAKTLTHRGGGKAAGKVGQQDSVGKVASGNFGEWDKPRTAFAPPRPQDETLDGSEGEAPRGPDGRRKTSVLGADGSIQHRDGERWPNGGRNVRSVWEIATQPYPDAHFATFPEALPERCIKAGTSERGCCPECGAPWVREVEKALVATRGKVGAHKGEGPRADPTRMDAGTAWDHSGGVYGHYAVATTGWRPTCDCLVPYSPDAQEYPSAPVPCTVLDPFCGAGTTALVARKLGRKSIGIELSPEYAALCAKRLQQLSLLATEGAA